jgi:hypothetical protein
MGWKAISDMRKDHANTSIQQSVGRTRQHQARLTIPQVGSAAAALALLKNQDSATMCVSATHE